MAIRPGRWCDRDRRRLKLATDAVREGKKPRKRRRRPFSVDEETPGRAYAAAQGTGASR
ncbi:MAG TPA: hypothetical protein VMR25_04640 [Planctomycetaceae bacterium]|jgi:hypothetical protein|nr:hypothetical protein [Planctomycetaceae bacterium]